MADFLETDLDKRLSLYQRFVKIYEHHSDLLESILQLENIERDSNPGIQNYFMEGVIEESGVSLVTNLSNGKTQRYRQSQKVWILGRDPVGAIFLCNPYISRHHAVIQYVDSRDCFYFTDLSSTNGSFINDEPVYYPVELRDGDRIRIGTFVFSFFINSSGKTLPVVNGDILTKLDSHFEIPVGGLNHYPQAKTKLIDEARESTVQFTRVVEARDEKLEIPPSLICQRDEVSQHYDRLLQNS